MEPLKGQITIVQKYFNTTSDNIEIIAEAGNDTGKTFLGSFIVRIKTIGVFRFDNDLLIRQVK